MNSDHEVILHSRINCEDFNIHFNTSSRQIGFDVYPVVVYIDSKNNKTREYKSFNDESITTSHFSQSTHLKKLSGSYVWRGCWEGRLYFTDDEYWGEDIETLSRLYSEIIIPWCESFITNRDVGVII